MAEGGLEKTLTESKVGGVPVWGIGVGLGALIVIILYIRSRRNAAANAASATAEPVAPGLTFDQGGVGSTTGYPSIDPTNPAYPVGLPAQGLPGPVTNVQWSRLVADELLAKGNDPTIISNALSKYLSGATLTAAEQAIINLALQIFGAPPEGLIPITVGNPPNNAGNAVAPSGAHITGRTKDSLTVAWNGPANANSYKVHITGGMTGDYGPVNAPTMTWMGLKPNTSYQFTVTTVLADGSESPPSGPTQPTKTLAK